MVRLNPFSGCLRSRHCWVVVVAAWSLLVVSSLLMTLAFNEHHISDVARERGRHMFRMIELTRLWNARHGGVYVPVTETTQPNPYLDLPDRDVTTLEGVRLTKINPAYMTRQLSELARREGVVFHITSLNPIRPENLADEWEAAALAAFERGVKEVVEQVGEPQAGLFRYMAPLVTRKSCLQCHARQGYREGDIRGGISITMENSALLTVSSDHVRQIVALHLVAWGLVSVLLALFLRGSRRYTLALEATREAQAGEIEARTRELREANGALEKERAFLQYIIDGVAEPVMVISADFRLELINREARRYLRPDDPDPRNAFCYQISHHAEHPCDSHEHPCPLVLARESGKPAMVVHVHTLPSGESRHIELLASPLFDADGSFRGIIESGRDISERVLVEQALRESEARFRRLAENATDVIYRMSIPDGRYDYVSPASREVFGHPPEAFYANPLLIRHIVHPDWQRYFEQEWRRLLKGRMPPVYEYQIVRADGEERWVNQRNVLVRDEAGRPVAIEGIATDITERRRMEEALREAISRSDQASRAKSEFLATMSHEIRTPMNVVVGMSDVLLDSPLDEEQRRYVQMLRRSGNTLLDLINDILDLSRIEAGQLELEPRPFDMVALVTETCEVIGDRARAKGIEFTVDLSSSLPRVVLGDGPRVREICFNLMGNAVKFTQKGRVAVSLTEAPEGEGVLLEVRDTGIGISVDRLDVVFEKFIQADSSVTRRFGGTGLGLAITKHLVELMGGTITVESHERVGSTFRVWLPLPASDQTPEPAEGEPLSPSPSAGGLRILLAEDNEDNQVLIRTFLSGSDHRLDVVGDGSEALVRIKQERYDLVLMDMQMPVMDGYTATRAIRKWERAEGRSRVPIVALTAYALKGDEQKSLDAGCDLYLTKPIKKRTLLEALARQGGGEAPPG